MLERNVILMERELGIYVHIPFCIKKCAYCDFISYPNKLEMQKTYVDKMLEEMDNSKKIIGKCNITSIYIGGGTPSAIDSELIKKIVFKIKELKKNSFVQEITIEVNPGTVTQQKLNDYIEAGINRLSIGLQSTNDNLLRLIGRIHTYQEFLKTYEMAVNTGFKNINVDLMIGLPNQTIGDIKESIDKITSLNPMPQHISVYSLIVEPNTLMEKWVNEEKFDLPLDEEERNQYAYVKNILEQKGYKHYEISNFARAGKYSVHNSNYWSKKPYIGLGPSAHSFNLHSRQWNVANVKTYSESLDKDILKFDFEELTEVDQYNEYIMTGLRTMWGINLDILQSTYKKYWSSVESRIAAYIQQGWAKRDGNHLVLTERGWLVSDYIFCDLFVIS